MSPCLDDVDLGLVVNLRTLREVLKGLSVGGKHWWIPSNPRDALETRSIRLGHGHPRCRDSVNTSRFVLPVLNDEMPNGGTDSLVVILHRSTLFALEPGLYMDRCPTDVGDGILTAYEVTGMDLEGTRLVNLTACETGVGSVTAEGVVGLREGFLLAGARALTMSMWEIPVEETMQQMSEFYDHWLGSTKAIGKPSSSYEAFLEAQLASLHRARAVRSGSGHPFYWAGTIYVGDPGDLPMASAATAQSESRLNP
jgi:hypothetical protein